MSRKSRILALDKLSRSHSTFIPLAGEVVKYLHQFPEVTKMSFGIIKPERGPIRKLKVSLDNGSLRIQCRDFEAIQYLYIFGPTKEFVEQKLKEGELI